jgi:prepilin-type N-terminal cleavage/methylation domain-containing protein
MIWSYERGEMKTKAKKRGFTLIELLMVIAIIGILSAILIPVAGGAKETALKRRAALEMQSIKMAVMQFQSDHRYMPWTDAVKVGPDQWVTDNKAVMEFLTGSNAMKKIYLQIPQKSQGAGGFVDPWGQAYQIGMDRNLDGAVDWGGKTIMEKVLVYSKGPTGKNKPLKTFDVMQ